MPENEQTLGLPEGRRVIHIDEVPSLSAKEKKDYDSVNKTINIAVAVIDLYETYLTAKTVSESTLYNKDAQKLPQGFTNKRY